MNKYEKSILIKPKIFKVCCILLCLLNVFIPMYNGGDWKFNLCQFFMCFCWIYTTMAACGYICKNTHEIQGDMILYEQSTSSAMIMIFLTRLAEGIWAVIFHKDTFNWLYFGVLCVIDLLMLVFIMLDKSNYGYAREVKDKDLFQ